MNGIGKPDHHYPEKTSVQGNGETGGFIEERLAKLEYETRDLNNVLTNQFCILCEDWSPEDAGRAKVPICKTCITTLGALIKVKKTLKFLE